jgi:16S rRNA (uracil1498-N3)-methyltransferase
VKEFVASATGHRILLNETESELPLAQAVRAAASGETTLAIGPEGGWTEEEIALFEGAGWQSVSLGPTILRAETAAIAALAIAACTLREPRS